MGQKHYSQVIRDEAVLFSERGHTFAETHAKYGVAESTFFEWKKRFDRAHPLHGATNGARTTRKAQLHLEKLALELEVIRQCPYGVTRPRMIKWMQSMPCRGDTLSMYCVKR